MKRAVSFTKMLEKEVLSPPNEKTYTIESRPNHIYKISSSKKYWAYQRKKTTGWFFVQNEESVAALNSKYIDQLIVSTDSNEIKKVAEDYGAEVPFLRPKKLAKDKVASVDSLYHAVKKYEKLSSRNYDFIIELLCLRIKL